MPHSKFADAMPANGIVWAYRFAPDGLAAPIPQDRVDAALAAHDGGWVWVHLALADARCRAWISQHAPVSEAARELLAGPDRHLRLDIVGDEIHGVIPDLHQEFAQHGDDIVVIRFVMTERMMITARQRPAHSVENNRRAIEAGKRFPTAVSLLDAVVDQFADAVARMAEKFGDELDAIEDRILRDEPSDDRGRIGQVRLKSVRVHRQLAQLRAVFHRLELRLTADNFPVARAIRKLAQKLDAIDHEVHLLHERARLLIDELGARMVAVTNRRLYTLSILSVCLLPATLVTGFFGMNTHDMPFQSSGGTGWALAVTVAAPALSYWILRRFKAL